MLLPKYHLYIYILFPSPLTHLKLTKENARVHTSHALSKYHKKNPNNKIKKKPYTHIQNMFFFYKIFFLYPINITPSMRALHCI